VPAPTALLRQEEPSPSKCPQRATAFASGEPLSDSSLDPSRHPTRLGALSPNDVNHEGGGSAGPSIPALGVIDMSH
jgi:hypothetical protein